MLTSEREKYLKDLLKDNRKLWANCMTNPLKEVFEELDRVREQLEIAMEDTARTAYEVLLKQHAGVQPGTLVSYKIAAEVLRSELANLRGEK